MRDSRRGSTWKEKLRLDGGSQRGLARGNRKVERNSRWREREKERRRDDWPFLPRTGPLQNVIMLIRDWLENVKCTKRSTAGYHASPHWRTVSLPLASLLSSTLVPLLVYRSPSVSRLLLGAPDIYGIFLIARSLHSALLARSLARVPCLGPARLVPEDPGDRERFNLHYRRCQCGAHRAKLRPGFVAAFRDPPRYRDDDLAEINPPAGVLES